MTHPTPPQSQVHQVTSFQQLVAMPFKGAINAMCWGRQPEGDFAEIASKITPDGNITVVGPDHLLALELSPQGQLARQMILNDWQLLEAYGASPVLNVIKHYERDDDFPFFPTDVYSYHVDRSPVATDTFLCTYLGAPSDIIPNHQCVQKVLIPEIRAGLRVLNDGPEDGFEAFLEEHFFDLHYQPLPHAQPISLGVGNLWRLAVDHPESPVLPCVHRAPEEKDGQVRLLMIC